MTLEELKAQRDALDNQIEELERTAFEELKAKAASFGLQLVHAQPQKQRRKRRTKAEMEHARANGLAV